MGRHKVAILLSTPCFEDFFGKGFGLSAAQYVERYRNDFSWYYAAMFVEHGIVPFILVPSLHTGDSFTTAEGVHVRFLRTAPWYEKLAHLKIWRGTLGRYIHERVNARAFEASLETVLREEGIGTLYVQEYWTGRFDAIAARFGKSFRVVGADHGGTSYRQLSWFKRRAFEQAAALTAQTEDEAHDVERYGVSPIVLPNPVDTRFFTPDESRPSPCAGKTVLTIARFNDAQKRTSDLIEAMRYLPEDWTLRIFGTGPDRGLLEQRAREHGVTSRVEFAGFESNRQMLLDQYRRCDVFALPSAFEGLPMVVLEAMSAGKPVVVSDIRAFSELVVDGVNGLKIPVGQPRQLAQALEDAQARGAVLGAAARKTAIDRHSFDAFMEKFSALLIDNGRSRENHVLGHKPGRLGA